MRDVHSLEGKKRKFLTVDDILKAVRVIYPNATLQGSMCSYSFYNEGKLIGEAWISRNGKFWKRQSMQTKFYTTYGKNEKMLFLVKSFETLCVGRLGRIVNYIFRNLDWILEANEHPQGLGFYVWEGSAEIEWEEVISATNPDVSDGERWLYDYKVDGKIRKATQEDLELFGVVL